MDAILNDLGQLLVQALPTFFIVLFLYLYLKQVFFNPLGKVLAERDEATAGARRRASEALESANAKAAAYEQQIRAARNEIYREQEEQRRIWRDEQTAQVAEARKNANAQVSAARADLAEQAETAKKALSGQTQALADRITQAVLQETAV